MTFLVDNRTFRLHRAILWARSMWFRALLGEKWSGTKTENLIEITIMSADVFAIVVEYIYTSYVCSINIYERKKAGWMFLPRLLSVLYL